MSRDTTNGAWLALGVAGAAAAAGAVLGGRGSRALRGVPEDAWIYTDEKGRRWATDGTATIREDAPPLAAAGRGTFRAFWKTPEDSIWERAKESIPDLISHHATYANKPYPEGVEAYFNKAYGPLLKKAGKVQISRQDFEALKGGYGPFGPATAFDKNGEPWALVMPMRTREAHEEGREIDVVNQRGEPRTVKA